MFLARLVPRLSKYQLSIKVLASQSYSAETLNSTKPPTVRTVQDKWKARFVTENIPEADTSIINILAHVLQLSCPGDIEKNQEIAISDAQLAKIDELCECRLVRMPIQYIIREWEFRDLTLKMIPPVFIPRPETEELVELILQQIDTHKSMEFLEIGCGSGAITLSILKHVPMAHAIAFDQSKLACELTLENAKQLGLTERLQIFRHKLIDHLPEQLGEHTFDMIVSNPPYVPSKQLTTLEPEVKIYEDLRALDGGPDGMKIIKAILDIAAKHLRPEGILWLEVDTSHPPLIATYLEGKEFQTGLKYVSCYKDLFRNERFVEVVKI